MNQRFTPAVAAGLGLVALGGLVTGCVPMTEQTPPRGDLFAPLHEGNLVGFEHQLALDDHAARDDAWTDVGRALLDLVNCRALSAPTARVADDPEAYLVYTLIRLEDHRRQRLLRQPTDGAWHADTLHARLSETDHFERQQRDDNHLVQWPTSAEAWPDEWPDFVEIESECRRPRRNLGLERFAPPWNDVDPNGLTGHLVVEWRFTEMARAAARMVDGSLFRDLDADLASHRTDLAIALNEQTDPGEEARATVDEFTEIALRELRTIESKPDDTTHASRLAWLAMLVGQPQLAIDSFQPLLNHPNEAVARTSQYYVVATAWRQGWWDIGAETAQELIDGPQSLRSAHAYFAATAHRHAGQPDAFLGLARDALRDRRRNPDDPFLGALYREVLRELARYEVDERTEELLEEFGPRGELDIRRREFAEVALDVGRPEVAEKMVAPLVDDTRDARRLPRLHAILALAAFMDDDRREFNAQIERLLAHRDELRSAIPRHRRGAFFAHQDAELARVLRAMLPVMAEWGDDPAARALRQQWLVSITEHTQAFLRRAPESAVSDNLTDLYNLAGQLLDDHPRGYAERVGSETASTSALILGTVDMPPAPPLDQAPRPRLRWPAVHSLLRIPYGGVPPADFSSALEPPEEPS